MTPEQAKTVAVNAIVAHNETVGKVDPAHVGNILERFADTIFHHHATGSKLPPTVVKEGTQPENLEIPIKPISA